MNMTAIFIVGIVTWGIVSIVKMGTNKPKLKDKEKDSLVSEVETLKARVETLEKIVTDENYDLKKQFANLEKDQVA